MKKGLAICVLVILLGVGLFYRTYSIGDDSYWIDESYTVLAAKQIGEEGVPRFDSGEYYWRAWPQTYALFLIGSVFGYGHAPMRILSAIVGTALIAVVFFVARRLYGTPAALIASGFMAFSYYQIAWSRQARMYVFLEMFFLLILYWYLRWYEEGRSKHLAYALASALVAYVFHAVALLLIPIILAHYILMRWRGGLSIVRSGRAGWRRPTVIVCLVVIAAVMYALYVKFSGVILPQDYVDEYRVFLYRSQQFFVFFAAVGLFAYPKNTRRNLLLAIATAGVFCVLALLVKYLNFRYLFILLPLLYLLAAQGVLYVVARYPYRWYRAMATAVVVVTLIAVGFLSLPQSEYPLEPMTPQPPFAEAYDALQGRLGEDDLLIVTQPAIAELYARKPDYWIAISYVGVPVESAGLYDSATLTERYTGARTLATAQSLERVIRDNQGFVIVDDMGLQRMTNEQRGIVLNLTRVGVWGNVFWSRTYVYEFR